jgi:NADPH:quinone reductase-like Zn-dependent oxidoreductase
MNDLLQLFASGQLKPNISHTLPLEKTPEAFATLLQRKVMGKVLILPQQQSRL